MTRVLTFGLMAAAMALAHAQEAAGSPIGDLFRAPAPDPLADTVRFPTMPEQRPRDDGAMTIAERNRQTHRDNEKSRRHARRKAASLARRSGR